MNLNSTLVESYNYFKLAVEIVLFATYGIYTYLEVFYRFLFPPPLKTLEGETILISGAGGEIGKHICKQLAQTGSKIICVDHNSFDNDVVFKELRDAGTKVFRYDVDISQRTHVEDLAIKIRREVGDVTIVINAAEMMPIDDFVSQSPDLLERTFELNVLSQFWILKQFLPSMIEKKRGHVVTICSMAGIIGSNQAVGYSSSKFAVNGYLESLKDEISNYPTKPDIKFTTAYPFLLKTNLSKGISFRPRFSSLTPIAEPSFVAQEVINGMRRNYEYIYCPSSLYLYDVLAALSPFLFIQQFYGISINDVYERYHESCNIISTTNFIYTYRVMPRKLQRAGKNFLHLDIQRSPKQIMQNGKCSPASNELLKED